MDFKEFYGCTENPFAIDPDPRFLFLSESHREALATLQYGIKNRKGFLLLLAEAGLGKTLLIQHLIHSPDAQVRIIYFPQIEIPFLQMLKDMLGQLHLKSELETKGSMLHSLYHHLIESLGRQENVVLVLDQAEQIRLDLLEEVRLLANLETGTSKLLQIVLLGRPLLGKKLHSDIVRQIEQRISVHGRIDPLTAAESISYVDHRLKTAGGSASAIFTDQALNLICKSAKGIPLAINILCANTLLLGYCRSEKKISVSTVKAILHEKNLLTEKKAKTLASKIKGRLIRRLFIILPGILLLAMAFLFGKDYLQFPIAPPRTIPAETPVVVKQPAPLPDIPQTTSSDPSSTVSVAKTDGNVPETNHTPAQPPAANNDDPQIRILKTVEVARGDNLSLLSVKNYRMVNETLMDHILKLNPEITNPHLLLPNRKVRIPEITESLLIVRDTEDRYKLHLRTFGNLQNAERYKRLAAKWTTDIEIVPWKISARETWYRVMTGPFSGRDKALKAVGEMQQKGFSLLPSQEEKTN